MNSEQIRHVVVLMLENRSFDQMLGALQTVNQDVDGVDAKSRPRCEVCEGTGYLQVPFEGDEGRIIDPDPPHELDSVLRTLDLPEPPPPSFPPEAIQDRVDRILAEWRRIKQSWTDWEISKPRLYAAPPSGAPAESYFVAEYARASNTTYEQRAKVMKYYPLDYLPAIHTLAREFTICDRWFASVPGPTWTNRFFVHSGTSCGIARMMESKKDWSNLDVYDQRTIYDALNEATNPASGEKLCWRIYLGGIPQTAVMLRQFEEQNFRNYRGMNQFYIDAGGDPSKFTDYAFIEPDYGINGNDDHPPSDVMRGENLIARVYNALRGNEPLWQSTLLIVLFDEHGGFYDHCILPPHAVPPGGVDRHEWTFDSFGVRVPALLVSPWVGQGVFHGQMDHTSLLRFLCAKWNIEPWTERIRAATSLESAITDACRVGTVKTLNIVAELPPAPRTILNELQSFGVQALHWALNHYSGQNKRLQAGANCAPPPNLLPHMAPTALQYEAAKSHLAGLLASNS